MTFTQEELLKVANAKKDYTDLADRVEELRNEKEKILKNMAEEKNEQSRLIELEEFLENQELEIESYDEDLVRKLKVYTGNEHPHAAQAPEVYEF